ncbi:MAG: YceI family protein [Gloeobacteraceae cyanobacterium ES-bin-316]|nr:YceI family protein [Ferruginibacter sp.]
MKSSLKKNILLFALTIITTLSGVAQTSYHSKAFDIRLNGTSNIHDWEMKALAGSSEASLMINASGQVTSLTSLSFTLPAVNLKSKHTQMDKNTYKALNTTKNPNISFVLTSATITPTGGNNYQLSCVGKLSIAGTVKHTDLVATGKYNPADKSFTVTGMKKMKMTDYGVAPPKAMMGTIKTGDAISISYNLKFTK